MKKVYIKDLIWVILIPISIGVIMAGYLFVENGYCTPLRGASCIGEGIILAVIFLVINLVIRLVIRLILLSKIIKNSQFDQKNKLKKIFIILLCILILVVGFILYSIGYTIAHLPT